jgi:hypothetical protein
MRVRFCGTIRRARTLLVARGEVEVVLAVRALRGVGRPELLGHPLDVLLPERDAVVGDGAADAVHGEDVVVDHVVLVAAVVERDVGVAVVGRVDVDPAVEDVRGRVRRVDVRDERGGHRGRVRVVTVVVVED